MPNDTLVALCTTYLLHSTLLLGGAWLMLAVTRTHSAALHERLWKIAALAPLLTAPLQLAAADRLARWSVWTLPGIVVTRQTFDEPVQPPSPDSSSPSSQDADSATIVDDGSTVEILPRPEPGDWSAEQELPSIEPAPAADDSAFPEIIAEPSGPEFVEAEQELPAGGVVTDELPSIATHGSTDTAEAAEIAAAPPPMRSPHRPISAWRRGLATAATLIVLLGLLRLAGRGVIARCRLYRSQTIASGPLRDALDRLVLQRDVRRRVRLATSPSATEPAAGGVFRWTIIVPTGIDERLSPAEQHALLAHELAHLVRRDPLWLWIGAALCTCLPFQPLNFLAVHRWRQAAEELCDDWAVAGGVRPLTLANCLTRVAEWRLAPMPLGLTADVGKSRFARRISRLVNGESQSDRWAHPVRRRLLAAAALACVALLTCCGPRMQAGASRGDSPEAADDQSAAGADEWVARAGLSAAKEAPDRNDAAILNRNPPDDSPTQSATESWSTSDAPLSPSGGEGGRRPGEGRDTTPDTDAELASLLGDLERVDTLIGESSDDPELTAARASLRQRLRTLRARLK